MVLVLETCEARWLGETMIEPHASGPRDMRKRAIEDPTADEPSARPGR